MKNKVIIITGASSGIGKALAIQLSQKENKLMLASRNHDKLKNVVDKLNIKNKNIIGYPTNVGNAEDCLFRLYKTGNWRSWCQICCRLSTRWPMF